MSEMDQAPDLSHHRNSSTTVLPPSITPTPTRASTAILRGVECPINHSACLPVPSAQQIFRDAAIKSVSGSAICCPTVNAITRARHGRCLASGSPATIAPWRKILEKRNIVLLSSRVSPVTGTARPCRVGHHRVVSDCICHESGQSKLDHADIRRQWLILSILFVATSFGLRVIIACSAAR